MDTGITIAKILAGSWRQTVPLPDIPQPLPAEVCEILLKTGAAGLGWRRLSQIGLDKNSEATPLRQAYRLHILENSTRESETAQAFDYLRSAAIEPILCKGWAVARLYPERGLRPYGDIDLLIRPEEAARAHDALLAPSAPGLPIDLHEGSQDLTDRTFDQIHRRSQAVSLRGVDIRILGPEDHLRLLCIHMLRHGAFRPLWLCDIALVMESLPQKFDWEYFLSGDSRRTDWVACALGLAHAVLDAHLGDWPISARARRLPRWLVPALLRQWSAREFYIIDTSPLRAHLLQPARALHAARLRWPNAIHATVELGAAFNELPRLPFQAADAARRASLFALRLFGNGSKKW